MDEEQNSADLPVDLVMLSFVDAKHDGTEEVEYEVMSDAYVTGTGICGSTVLNLIEFSDKPVGGHSRRYNLKMVYLVNDDVSIEEEDARRTRRQETGLGVADELLSLASVFTRRRFWINAKTREEGRAMYTPQPIQADRDQPHSEESLAGLSAVIEQLGKLPPKAQQTTIIASRFYRRALLTQVQDGEVAYVLLVSAIEVLANYAGTTHALEDFLRSDIIDALERVEDIRAKRVLTEYFHEVGGATAKFWKTVVALIPDAYYHPDPPYERGWIAKGEIKRFAQNVYKARSKLLHAGKPFDEGVLEPLHPGEPDIYPGIRVMRGAQKFARKKDRLLQFHALERLVHHLILEFVRCGGEIDFSRAES